MNKRLNRILRPGMGAYFIIMGVFCCATLLFEYYWLAAVECGVTLLTLALYLMDRRRRSREINHFLQTASGMEQVSYGDTPFPMVLVRLGDNGIVWTNDQFANLTDFADTMLEHQLEELLPGFSTDWLLSGKSCTSRI